MKPNQKILLSTDYSGGGGGGGGGKSASSSASATSGIQFGSQGGGEINTTLALIIGAGLLGLFGIAVLLAVFMPSKK
jgi:hypothetical protein